MYFFLKVYFLNENFMQTSSTVRILITSFLSMEIFLSHYKAPGIAVYNMRFKICKEDT